MSCPHIAHSSFQPPRDVQTVHREECTQCFDTQDGPDGIDVCLECFNGGCTSSAEGRHHALTHYSKNGARHGIAVNVRRRKREAAPRESQEPPLKKLAIREEEPEHLRYTFQTQLKCYACAPEGRDLRGQPGIEQYDAVVAGVMRSMSSAQKSEVKAWEEEIETCGHTRHLEQQAASRIDTAGLAHCGHCDLAANLWLCLTCGALGCGRQQYGGTGGNGHGLLHYEETGHPVAVKLGTIQPEGSADIYCYTCNEERIDPHLQKHLANFGIDVLEQTKTEKSMTEMVRHIGFGVPCGLQVGQNVEHNLKHDYAMTGEDGKELEPLAGPSLTGMRNLGNSCYMASTLQAVFSLPEFATRYLLPFATHSQECPIEDPANCIECQMGKVADGLISGRYAIPSKSDTVAESSDAPAFQEGIRPFMFKALIGKGHPEFATMRQQDAAEFLEYLCKTLQGSNRRHSLPDATRAFRFVVEQKIKCNICGGIRLRADEEDKLTLVVPAIEKTSSNGAMDVDASHKGKAAVEGEHKKADPKVTQFEAVQLNELLRSYVEPRIVEEYTCPKCRRKVTATQTFRFATFPDVLVIHAARFRLENWVQEKLEVPIALPATLTLDDFLATGKLEGEEELPEDTAPEPKIPEFNAPAMSLLTGMGFPEIRCQKALLATGNSDGEAAMNWLFQHMEDPDIDEPINLAAAEAPADAIPVDDATVALLGDMGFTPAQARQALRETGGNADRAVDWLFNHPDATGDDAPLATAGPSQSEANVERAGSNALPASYKLKAFISHKGPSVHSGHYIAHVHGGTGRGWVLFNDEKVVKAEGGAQSAELLAPQAYLYIFTRE